MAATVKRDPGKYAKAIVSALASGAAVALTALQDGHLSGGELVGVALAVLAALGVTYTVPNSPPAGTE